MQINKNYILSKFNIESKIEPYGDGHINDTYATAQSEFIMQRINTNVFKNPDELMQNIENVTTFLKAKIADEYGDPERETLTIIKAYDGKNYYMYDENNVFRLYKFITGTKTIENSKTAASNNLIIGVRSNY